MKKKYRGVVINGGEARLQLDRMASSGFSTFSTEVEFSTEGLGRSECF
jgi:hypothetical protein